MHLYRLRAPLRTALALTGAAAIVTGVIACGTGSAAHPSAGTGFAGAALPASSLALYFVKLMNPDRGLGVSR